MIRRSVLPAALLVLTGCSALPERARHQLVGTTLPDLVACAGRPESRMRVGVDDWVLGWAPVTTATPAITGAVPVLGDLAKPTISANASATCRMSARMRGGRVVSLHYVSTSSLPLGAKSACAPIVRDCLAHPDRTVLPAGYDADAILEDKS